MPKNHREVTFVFFCFFWPKIEREAPFVFVYDF